MTRNEQIELLMMDNCTRSEAEKHLNDGAIVFEDFEKYCESYLKEWDTEEDLANDIRKMVDTKRPAPDWGVVNKDGKYYFIMYVL